MADLRDQLQASLGDAYILEEELRGGGMSRVFLAHEAALKRKVVVKVLPPEMSAEVSAERFRREIYMAAQLQHPHIVPVLTAGDTGGLLYFTMPYVRGESLRGRIEKEGELPVPEAVRILRDIALALAYAHDNGVVHRDIKPENVLISGGTAAVTDFGVAKAVAAAADAVETLTSHSIALGTPGYMAPEQATADPNVDHRADIYALGVVAYEMLSGTAPFVGRSQQATLAAHVTETPEPISKRRPGINPAIAALVMSCLEKRPANRPQSAHDVLRELDALTTAGGTHAALPAPASGYRGWRFAALAGIAAIVLAGGALAVMKMRSDDGATAKSSEPPLIAVLPFENVGRPEGREFADGMTEEITSRLSSLSGLRVIGRQTSQSYAGTKKTPRKIAEEIGVDYLLTGTVRWDRSAEGKEMVRVSPAVVRTTDETQVWAQPFETVLSGIFEVQSKIAGEVASALNVALREPEKGTLAAKPTTNVAAYSFYLKGTELFRNAVALKPVPNAIEALEKAVALDPDFALAHARLSLAHDHMYWFNLDPSEERRRRHRAAAERALALNPSLAEAHHAMALYHYHVELDFDKALEELSIAERLAPNDPEVAFTKGAIKRRQGKWQEALANMKRAVEIEPRFASPILDLGNTHFNLRQYDEADRLADQAIIVTEKGEDAYGRALDMKADIAIFRDADLAKAVRFKRERFYSDRDRDWAVLEALLAPWPATTDPEIKRQVLALKWKPEFGAKRRFFAGKMLAHYAWEDLPQARIYAESALTASRAELRSRPNEAGIAGSIAQAHAILGHREAALREIARAVSLRPVTFDAYSGPVFLLNRANTLVIAGEHDEAISQLEELLRMPSRINRNFLRLSPLYEPLRSNPKFQRLIN